MKLINQKIISDILRLLTIIGNITANVLQISEGKDVENIEQYYNEQFKK